ncbi:MAG: NosD domain-containing protein [Candidatus Lokiarchaeia archaeon]
MTLSSFNIQYYQLFMLSPWTQTFRQPLSKQYTDVTWTNPIISNVNISQDLNITLNGNLTITGTGELHLIHCILNVNNGTSPVQYGINVTGGKLYINGTSTITAINRSYPYFFVVYSGSTFQMNDSMVEYCGHISGSDPDQSGLTVRADNIWIENSTLAHGFHGLVMYESQGSTILNSRATDNTQVGFKLNSSDYSNLTGNTATNNTYGFYLLYSDYSNLTGNTAANSTYGFFLYDSDANNLTGNIALNCTTGYYWFISVNNDFRGSVEANYLRVNVTAFGGPFPGVEAEVVTDGTTVYATPHFGGSNATTDPYGLTPWIAVPYRIFTGNDTMAENATTVTVWSSTAPFSNNPRTVSMSTSHVETFKLVEPLLQPITILFNLLLTFGVPGGISPTVYGVLGIVAVGAVIAVVLLYYIRRVKPV